MDKRDTVARKIVNLEDGPRWGRLIAWLADGYMERAVTVQHRGKAVAVLMDPDAARAALALADRFRKRRPPFTRSALDKWTAKALSGLDLSALPPADT